MKAVPRLQGTGQLEEQYKDYDKNTYLSGIYIQYRQYNIKSNM